MPTASPTRGGEAPERPIRVALADDDVLLREGLASLLERSGFEVVGQAGDGGELLALVGGRDLDLAIIDIRMPPDHTDDGARAARTIRSRHPELGIVLLSQHVETRHSVDLVSTGRFGYLLKDRVLEIDDFVAAVRRVARGGTAVDPDVVARLVGRRPDDDPLRDLSPREREVLALMAEGKSNSAIARALVVSEAAVGKHIGSILTKLDLPPTDTDHRRVLAVLRFLGA